MVEHGHARTRSLLCPACQESHCVPVDERRCPTCGTTLSLPQAGARQGRPDALGSGISTLMRLLERLSGETMGPEAMAELGRGGQGTPDGVISKLERMTLHKTSNYLLGLQLTVLSSAGGGEESGAHDMQMDAALADFSPLPPPQCELVTCPADPLTAHEPLRNAGALEGKLMVCSRGQATFASIMLRAKAAGAAGVCVVNHLEPWPYLMRDSKGEVKPDGGEPTPFMFMVPRAPGQELLKRLGLVRISLSELDNECLICQEGYQEGATLIRLPCTHAFDEQCLLQWLKLQHSCPACRYELPTEDSQRMRLPGPGTDEPPVSMFT